MTRAVRRRLAYARSTIFASAALCPHTATRWLAYTCVARAATALATRNTVAVGVTVTTSQGDRIGVNTSVRGVADPIRGALFVEIALARGGSAGVIARLTYRSRRAVTTITRAARTGIEALAVFAKLGVGTIART